MPNIETLEIHIKDFDIETKTSSELGEAYKLAKTFQEQFKQNSPGFKLLTKFQSTLMKRIKSLRTSKSIEELDAETEARQKEIEEAHNLLKSRKQKD